MDNEENGQILLEKEPFEISLTFSHLGDKVQILLSDSLVLAQILC